MTEIDEQIKMLGYKIRVTDLSCCYIVYENEEDDTEVIIEWDSEDKYCMIFARTISKQKDWFGNLYQEPSGLTQNEYLVFNAKIQEMRNNLS